MHLNLRGIRCRYESVHLNLPVVSIHLNLPVMSVHLNLPVIPVGTRAGRRCAVGVTDRWSGRRAPWSGSGAPGARAAWRRVPSPAATAPTPHETTGPPTATPELYPTVSINL